jgi:S-adenosylmethionine-diacylglycerol 3-amino-3-carboxypropyl transferase
MVKNWIGQHLFNQVHSRNLVYNTCWEDPRLDREALQLTSSDSVMVITSAGCNALDYALAGAKTVHAVDVNPLQNALLELKLACAKTLDYDRFFELFGRGALPNFGGTYHARVRPLLPSFARKIWDRRLHLLDGSTHRGSLYFCGSSGFFAYWINFYIDRIARVRDVIHEMLKATSIECQQRLFHEHNLGETVFGPMLRWFVSRDSTMSMLGVPRAQRMQIDKGYPGGIAQFIMDRVQHVFTQLALSDNYFWRVYLTGQYTPQCCPEYLVESNYDKLREVAHRVSTNNSTVTDFLKTQHESISRFVLLDHMDWLAANHCDALAAEWQQIAYAATPDAKVLWRTAGLKCDFIDPLEVECAGGRRQVGALLRYRTELADSLHQRDRVNTYGRFYVADLNTRDA